MDFWGWPDGQPQIPGSAKPNNISLYLRAMKDNFSIQSAAYARFRPGYPEALLEHICAHCSNFDAAWDCATGNGQIAAVLADHFQQVEATDLSENQLKNAIPKPNIIYRMAAAEDQIFAPASFDLITVGQAAHWFDLEKFYAEVRRVLRPGGVLALIGYNLLTVDPETDALVRHLYTDVLGEYWDAERRLVETAYSTLPFPFAEIDFPDASMTYEWEFGQLIGYLNTWSALQHFVKETGASPLTDAFVAELREVWPEGMVKTVRFPIFGRMGR